MIFLPDAPIAEWFARFLDDESVLRTAKVLINWPLRLWLEYASLNGSADAEVVFRLWINCERVRP